MESLNASKIVPSLSVAEGGFSLQDFLSFRLEIGTSEEDNVISICLRMAISCATVVTHFT